MIPAITPDKWKHFFVGIAMGTLLQLGGVWLLVGHIWWATALVFAIVIAISYGFELFSKFTGKGHYDVMDAVASIIGGVLGMGIAGLLWWNYSTTVSALTG